MTETLVSNERMQGMRRSAWSSRLLLAGFLACWAGFLHQLHVNWDAGSYYSYGWFVLPMAAWLARARWLDEREAWRATPPEHSSADDALIAALLLAHIPFRVVAEANPFWRLPLWGAGVTLVAATWLAVRHLAGRRAARGLAFPVAFLLTMLPWPSFAEGGLINTMTRAVVASNVELLRLLGHPAEPQGNVIAIGPVAVGVDDACSGIRSLQTLGMLALFVGEFWRLTPLRRVPLHAIAALAAFAFNVARALGLALCVIHGGHDLYSQWHDPAGYISLAGSSGVLLYSAWRLGRRGGATPPPAALPARAPAPARPRWITAGLVAAFGVTASAAPTLWFMQGGETGRRLDIAVAWPVSAPFTCTPLEIDERVREILGFDYGERLAIRPATGSPIEVWHYGFTGRSGSKSIAAYIHSPAVCMQASGARLDREHERLDIDLGPFALPFRHYTFRSPAHTGGRPIQVFWCMWEGVPADQVTDTDDFRAVVLDALKSRRRNLERSVILIGVHDETAEGARRIVTRLVHRSISPVIDGVQMSYHP